MGNFQDRDNRGGGGFRGGNGGGGRQSFGGNRGGDRGERREVSMHKAVCDECKKSCEVPFRPSSDKPIYCSDCFGSKRGNEAPRREFNNDRGPKRNFNDKPSFSKPAQSTQSGSQDDIKKQLNEMNSKLDRLANAIEKMTASKVASDSTVATKPVVKIAQALVVKKAEVKKAPVKASLPVKKVVVKAPAKKIVLKKKK